MTLKEAHVQIFNNRRDQSHEANAFIGRKRDKNNIYTAGHTHRDVSLPERVVDAVLSGHVGDLFSRGDVRFVQFAGGKVEAVVFMSDTKRDIAVSKSGQEHKIHGEGIIVGGYPEKGDKLSVVGYHHGIPTTIPSKVVEENNGKVVIAAEHREDFYYPSLSGSSLVHDPNGEYRAVGIFSEGLIDPNNRGVIMRTILGVGRSTVAAAEILSP